MPPSGGGLAQAGVEGARRWGIAGAGRMRPPELDAGDGRADGVSCRAVLRAAVDGEAIYLVLGFLSEQDGPRRFSYWA